MGALILYLGAIAMTLLVFRQLWALNIGGLRGPWVSLGRHEWGGAVGYFVNGNVANLALLVGLALLAAAATILLLCRRPKRREASRASWAALAGLWTGLIILGGWCEMVRREQQPPGPPHPMGPVPTPFRGHTGQVTSAAFSPDGHLLASGGEDKTVRLWDSETASELATLEGHTAEVLTIAFSPDGSTLASGSVDGSIRPWDVGGRRESAVLRGHADKVRSVAFSPDGTTLASGSWDQTIRLWDVAGRREIATLEGHAEAVKAVAFSPDGKWLVTTSEWPGVVMWEVSNFAEPVEMHVFDHLWGVAWSADGQQFATCSETGVVQLWKTAVPQRIPSNTDGHAGRWVQGMFEPAFTGSKQLQLRRRVYAVAFSPDERWLATAGSIGEDGPRVHGGVQPAPGPAPAPLNLWRIR